MMRVSCIEHPPSSRFVILRPHYVELCGHGCAAMLLAVIEGWTNWRLQHIELDEGTDESIWLRLSLPRLQEDLAGAFGRDAIRTGISKLVELRFIDEQTPEEGSDRSKMYRLRAEDLQRAIDDHRRVSDDGKSNDHLRISDDDQRESDDLARASDGGKKNEEKNEVIVRLWELYKSLVNKPRSRLDQKRRRLILNALTICDWKGDPAAAEAKVAKALTGLSVSPFHNGRTQDNTTQYLELHHALKGKKHVSDEEQIEKMCQYADEHGGTIATVARDLPPGVSEIKVNNRLDLCRRYVASGRTFEPRRAREAKEELEAWGFEIKALGGPPWIEIGFRASATSSPEQLSATG